MVWILSVHLEKVVISAELDNVVVKYAANKATDAINALVSISFNFFKVYIKINLNHFFLKLRSLSISISTTNQLPKWLPSL
jgi:hypothetical protein